MEEMVPNLSPFRTVETVTRGGCAIWCQQEVECVTFSVTPLPAGSVTCFLYSRPPLAAEYQPEAAAVTMKLAQRWCV